MIFIQGLTTEDEVVRIYRSIIESNFVEQGGQTLVSWTSEGTTVQKSWAMSPTKILEECIEF